MLVLDTIMNFAIPPKRNDLGFGIIKIVMNDDFKRSKFSRDSFSKNGIAPKQAM